MPSAYPASVVSPSQLAGIYASHQHSISVLPSQPRTVIERLAGNSNTDDLTNVTSRIMLLLNLVSLAPGLAGVEKGSAYSTIQRYTDYLKEKRSSTYTSILSLSGLRGKACRDLVAIVYANLMAQDIRTQETAVIAIIISIIGGPESDIKLFIEAAIQDFVICHEAHRHILLTASVAGTLTNLPLPIAAASSLQSLPGFIALSPDRNPLGFASAWHDLFIIIFNLLCFEAFTTNNIGELHKALKLFDLNNESYANHPYRQLPEEPLSRYSPRIYQAYRSVIAACVDANCPELCPPEQKVISLLYAGVLPGIWRIADTIICEHNLSPKTFHEAMEIMLTAERRLSYQDPKVTMTKQLRASELPSASAKPLLPHSPSPDRSLLVTPPPSRAPPACPSDPIIPPNPPTPPGNNLEIISEFQALRSLFSRQPPLVDRVTQKLNGHTYYDLPSDFPRLSPSFRKLLGQRCTNCGDADALFPSHGWKQCPFFTPPHRTSLWPAHHSPIQSIANGGTSKTAAGVDAPAPDLSLSKLSTQFQNMNSYHARITRHESIPIPLGEKYCFC